MDVSMDPNCRILTWKPTEPSFEPLAQNRGLMKVRGSPCQKQLRISAFLILEAWFWVDLFNTGF